MNKQQLIDDIAEATDESKAVVGRVLEALTNSITIALDDGKEVTLHGIGKLKAVDKAARPGRNPKTGEPVTISARTTVKFTASKILKDAIY